MGCMLKLADGIWTIWNCKTQDLEKSLQKSRLSCLYLFLTKLQILKKLCFRSTKHQPEQEYCQQQDTPPTSLYLLTVRAPKNQITGC